MSDIMTRVMDTQTVKRISTGERQWRQQSLRQYIARWRSMMTNPEYRARQAIKIAAQRRTFADYQHGWRMVVDGKPYSECTTDLMRDGWIASYDADPALRRTGNRQPAT